MLGNKEKDGKLATERLTSGIIVTDVSLDDRFVRSDDLDPHTPVRGARAPQTLVMTPLDNSKAEQQQYQISWNNFFSKFTQENLSKRKEAVLKALPEHLKTVNNPKELKYIFKQLTVTPNFVREERGFFSGFFLKHCLPRWLKYGNTTTLQKMVQQVKNRADQVHRDGNDSNIMKECMEIKNLKVNRLSALRGR